MLPVIIDFHIYFNSHSAWICKSYVLSCVRFWIGNFHWSSVAELSSWHCCLKSTQRTRTAALQHFTFQWSKASCTRTSVPYLTLWQAWYWLCIDCCAWSSGMLECVLQLKNKDEHVQTWINACVPSEQQHFSSKWCDDVNVLTSYTLKILYIYIYNLTFLTHC